jgi:hypothetical protein
MVSCIGLMYGTRSFNGKLTNYGATKFERMGTLLQHTRRP